MYFWNEHCLTERFSLAERYIRSPAVLSDPLPLAFQTMKAAIILAALASVSANPTSIGKYPFSPALTVGYEPNLASPSCFSSLESASASIKRASDGHGFAHFDDWGVLTSYDSAGHAVQHAVVSWPATVAYFESLGKWDAFAKTGHLGEICSRNLTDDVHERIRRAREEKKEQGEEAWPKVPFECREKIPASNINREGRQLKPYVPPQATRQVQMWCLNTPCSRDSDCSSQGCGTCIMRDKFMFLSCSG